MGKEITGFSTCLERVVSRFKKNIYSMANPKLNKHSQQMDAKS